MGAYINSRNKCDSASLKYEERRRHNASHLCSDATSVLNNSGPSNHDILFTSFVSHIPDMLFLSYLSDEM